MKYKIFLFIATTVLFCACKQKQTYIMFDGQALGTFYHISYYDEQQRNLQPQVDSVLRAFNASLSVYSKESIISKVNRNEEVELDSFFTNVFTRSKEITTLTNGAFDISGAPLFSAWHFGPSREESRIPDSLTVDSLRQLVGMDKLQLVGNRLVKSDPRVTMNMNAIAKGYSSDVVGYFLESMGVTNYMVEIGGELRIKGKNHEGKDWTVAIDKPFDGNFASGESIQVILRLSNKGLATSGNYRQFYVENGKKYVHTIDPRTGYPVQQSLLSATVIAPDCLTADALATAFMVMGLEQAKAFLSQHPEYDAYLIYDDNGKFAVYTTPKMTTYIEAEE